jgi:Ni/Co efflux regulator RcnB
MKRLLASALALSMLTGAAFSGTSAMAQPGRHDDHGRYDNHDNRGGHGHHWARGQRLPNTWYNDRSHYVDYRAHHLRAPPRGYEWREVDGNYVMAAAATGLIASIIANAH